MALTVIASTWATATSVASGVQAVLLVALIRAVFKLRDRVAELEARSRFERELLE